MRKRVTMSWSGGKDSALALHEIINEADKYEVVTLHTLFDKKSRRVGLHGVREELIERQAEAIGIPLVKLYLPSSDNYEAYQTIMTSFYQECRSQLIEGVIFGDIFLEDLRKFREELLKPAGLFPMFPLWGKQSEELIDKFLNAGFKTLICSADKLYFNKTQVGMTLSKQLIKSLPESVDPCGENGEFHTFVYNGPLFRSSIGFLPGEKIMKTYVYKKKKESGQEEEMQSSFWFQDLFPVSLDDRLAVEVEQPG